MSKGAANGVLWMLGGFAVAGYFMSKSPDSNVTSSPRIQSANYSTPSTPSLDSLMPDSQKAFMSAIRHGQTAYKTGQNEMAKGASRAMRARELCGALRSGRAEGWVGTVSKLSSNGDGKGVLYVNLGEDIQVQTWNNAVSDSFHHTLIEPDTMLFTKASALREKQAVIFSGMFFKDQTDCFRESSMTLSGSMEEPEYIMKFTDINAIN